MGYLKKKYTKEYYLGRDSKGKKLSYGATNTFDKEGNFILREHDAKILNQVIFKNKNVLCLGCGRGEELIYAIEKGANVRNLVGVDFSPSAIEIAKDLMIARNVKDIQLYEEDALDFVARFSKILKNDDSKKFDIVIMFDFVEHVPRNELITIFKYLKEIIKSKTLLVINTPSYKYDNDVLTCDYDERNLVDSVDMSDVIKETKGMHCNKYSTISLQKFMMDCGFINLTEAHFFVSVDVYDNLDKISFLERWNYCVKTGFPMSKKYIDDKVEFPYTDNQDLRHFLFREGNLSGISLYTTNAYKNIAFFQGEIDVQMTGNLLMSKPEGKTIFDVGTFVGSSALVFSKYVGNKGKVLGFEPNPFNRNRIFLNLSHNSHLSENITIYPYALGKENSTETMTLSSQIDNGYSSTSRLNESHSKVSKEDLPDGFEEMPVEVKTLDWFVEKYNIVPDILKIDIEGAEQDLLLGAEKTIKKYKPTFYIEIHSEYSAVMCLEILSSNGYLVTIINEEEDNRIMIKAEYSKNLKIKSTQEKELQSFMNLNATLNLLKSMNIRTKELYKNFIKESEEFYKREEILVKEKNELLINNQALMEENRNLSENIETIRKENENLRMELSSLKGSKSWKITKPLRVIISFVKNFK